MINTREIAAEYRLAHWVQVLQERAQSGLSIKAYCQHLGICGNTYFYWHRRVRAAAAAATELGLRACDETQPPRVCFSEIRVAEATLSGGCRNRRTWPAPHRRRGVQLTVDSAYPVEQLRHSFMPNA